MIIPIIKSLSSPDIERPSLPPDTENCSVFLEVEIGSKNSEGADIFSFTVVTPNYLLENGELPRWGRGLLVVDTFSWLGVDNAIQRLLAHAYRPTWGEVAEELNKVLVWEFDNYQA